MIHLSRRKIKSREVFATKMCWFYGHYPYMEGGGGLSKKKQCSLLQRGEAKGGKDDISEEKAHFCREDLPKSYFLRPSLVFLPHTKSFILLLHLLHLGQTDY